MVRSLIISAVLACLGASLAVAQFAPPAPPQGATLALKCVQVSRALGKLVAALGLGKCPASCRGCGCNGGPGYRSPAGKCVGFADIVSVCGEAPHAKCTAECTIVKPECANFGRAWLSLHAAEKSLSLLWRDPDPKPSPSHRPAPGQVLSQGVGQSGGQVGGQTAGKTTATPRLPSRPATEVQTSTPLAAVVFTDSRYQCGQKHTCKEMASCEEAKFHYEKCGLKRLDGTGNGVPCKALCR